MTRRLLLSSEAETDTDEAVDWLRERAVDLPNRFRDELSAVFESILEYPEMCPIVYRSFRRALLGRFPYSVFYTVEPEAVLVIAVFHQARDPMEWMRRT